MGRLELIRELEDKIKHTKLRLAIAEKGEGTEARVAAIHRQGALVAYEESLRLARQLK